MEQNSAYQDGRWMMRKYLIVTRLKKQRQKLFFL